MAEVERPSPIRAVVFDWAGTTIDYGSRAPASVFQEIFERRGVPISEAEARGPMGASKRDHIAAIVGEPNVRERWRMVHGTDAGDDEIDAMYADFLPLQAETLTAHATLIHGTTSVVDALRRRGIAIGSTTGYTRALMDVLVPLARAQGYEADAVVCSDDVAHGRPAPWMMLTALERLNAYPVTHTVKVDDTPVGIVAGRNAGAWTIAVTQTGNAFGATQEAAAAMPAAERTEKLAHLEAMFIDAGAHYAIPSIAELPDALECIEQRLLAGEVPPRGPHA